MIAQGTDGLSQGIFLEGIVRGEDMLSFVDLLCTAIERHPGVLKFIESWVAPIWTRARYSCPMSGSARVMGSSAVKRTRPDYGYRSMQAMRRSTFGPPL